MNSNNCGNHGPIGTALACRTDEPLHSETFLSYIPYNHTTKFPERGSFGMGIEILESGKLALTEPMCGVTNMIACQLFGPISLNTTLVVFTSVHRKFTYLHAFGTHHDGIDNLEPRITVPVFEI